MSLAEHLHLPDSLVPTGNSRLLWSGEEGETEQLFVGRSLPLGQQRISAHSRVGSGPASCLSLSLHRNLLSVAWNRAAGEVPEDVKPDISAQASSVANLRYWSCEEHKKEERVSWQLSSIFFRPPAVCGSELSWSKDVAFWFFSYSMKDGVDKSYLI